MLLFKQEVVWDGILGLNFANKRLRTEGILPIFDTIMDKKLLSQELIDKLANDISGQNEDESAGKGNKKRTLRF